MKEYNQLLSVHASIWAGIYRREFIDERGIRFVEAKGAGYVDCVFRVDTMINATRIAYIDKTYYNYRVSNVESSTNNYSIGTMLERWLEVHEKYKDFDDFEKYSSALILEEYNSCFCKLGLMRINYADFQRMCRNINYLSNQVILESDYLSDNQKKNLIKLKKSPLKSYLSNQFKAVIRGIHLTKLLVNISNKYILINFLLVMLFCSIVLTSEYSLLEDLVQFRKYVIGVYRISELLVAILLSIRMTCPLIRGIHKIVGY
jgi:hypothetical protein